MPAATDALKIGQIKFKSASDKTEALEAFRIMFSSEKDEKGDNVQTDEEHFMKYVKAFISGQIKLARRVKSEKQLREQSAAAGDVDSIE